MDLTLRDYRDGDREAALGLFEELNQHEFAVAGDRRTDRTGAEACMMILDATVAKGGKALVAQVGAEVVGLMIWSQKRDDQFMVEEQRGYGYVDDLVVAQSHRGLGIGKALLARAERLTRDAGMNRLRLTVLAGNDGAVGAYERSGFRDYTRGMIKDLS